MLKYKVTEFQVQWLIETLLQRKRVFHMKSTNVRLQIDDEWEIKARTSNMFVVVYVINNKTGRTKNCVKLEYELNVSPLCVFINEAMRETAQPDLYEYYDLDLPFV